MISYQSFPSYNGNPGSYLLQLLFWFLSIPITAIANFIIGIAGGVTQGASSSAGSVSGFIGRVFSLSISGFYSFGPFAIVVASLVWGIAILILIFFIFKAIQLAAHETEDD
jgi:hypothetical protein